MWATESLTRPVLICLSKPYFNFSLESIKSESSVLITEFKNQQSVFFFTKPKDLNLPKGIIKKVVSKTKNGFSIILTSNVLQKDVFLFSKGKGHFSDNFFDLIPNQNKVIKFITKENSLNDLRIKTLNSIHNTLLPIEKNP